MTPPGSDTDRDVESVLVAGLRRMDSRRKLRRVHELIEASRLLALQRLRARYGAMTGEEERLRLAALRYDAATMRTVFGWDPDARGY